MDAREQIDAAITKWRARTHHKNLEANVSAEQVDAVSKLCALAADKKVIFNVKVYFGFGNHMIASDEKGVYVDVSLQSEFDPRQLAQYLQTKELSPIEQKEWYAELKMQGITARFYDVEYWHDLSA